MISNVGNAAIASDCPLTTISGNTVMGLEQQGIYVNANSTTVNGNTVIYDAGGKTNYGGITVTSGTSGVVISGNTLRYPYMGIILAGNNYDVAVTGNLINAPAFIGIGFAASVYKSTVSGNIIQAASAPAMSNAGMSLIGGSVIVTANIVDGTAVGFTTNCISLANSLNFTVMENQVDRCTYGIREVSGDDYNLIANNYFGATIRNSLTVVGTHDQVFHNFGYNPQPPAAIMVTASPFTYTNTHGYVELVTVSANGATIDEIDLRGENTNLTAGSFLLYPGDSITLTYSGGTPLMERYPQ
jgi:parallel beta-helix repeat protein